MNRTRKLLVPATLILTLIGMLVWFLLPPREPEYQGRKLSEWLSAYSPLAEFAGAMGGRSAEADEAVRQIRTKAIPTLLARLDAHDSPAKLKLRALLERVHLAKPEPHVRFRSLALNLEGKMGFLALGASAESAIPKLISLYHQTSRTSTKENVLEALGCIGPMAEAAVPLLVRATTNGDIRISLPAVWALGRIHAQPELSVPALMCMIQDTKRAGPSTAWSIYHISGRDHHEAAAEALENFGTNARPAIPLLLSELGIPGAKLYHKFIFAKAIKAIDPEAAKSGVVVTTIAEYNSPTNSQSRFQ